MAYRIVNTKNQVKRPKNILDFYIFFNLTSMKQRKLIFIFKKEKVKKIIYVLKSILVYGGNLCLLKMR